MCPGPAQNNAKKRLGVDYGNFFSNKVGELKAKITKYAKFCKNLNSYGKLKLLRSCQGSIKCNQEQLVVSIKD